MNYTVKRKIEIEGDSGQNLLEVSHEEGFSIWQQLNAIYGPDANPGAGAPVQSVPPVPPITTVTVGDVPTLRMLPIALQTPAVEVPAG